jgi:hypothetical protein
MVTITTRPTRSVDGITSRWTAAHNPVIYKFERRDHFVTSVTTVGENLRLLVDNIDDIIVGQQIYLKTNKYKGVATVVSAGGTIVTVSGLALNGNDGSGYLNVTRRNYQIQIRIYEVGSNILLGATACTPFTDGNGSKDVGLFVSAYLQLKNTFNYDAVNERDPYGSIKFYITAQEIWSGGSSTLINDGAQPIFAVNAAKQVGDVNGQNMAEYVLAYPTTRTAKFLTKFKRPVYFEGLPFSLSFIHSELLAVQLTKVEDRLDINKVPVATGNYALDIEEQQSVNRLMLAGGYSDTVKFVRLKIVSGSPAVVGYVYPGYVAEGYVAIS